MLASTSTNAAVMALDIGDTGPVEPATELHDAMPARNTRRSLFHVVCMERRQDAVPGDAPAR